MKGKKCNIDKNSGKKSEHKTMYTTRKLQVLQHVQQTGYKRLSIKIIF